MFSHFLGELPPDAKPVTRDRGMTKVTALRPIWDLWNLCDWLQESGRALNIHAAAVFFVFFRTRDGQHSSHQNGDDVGVLYEIGFATLPTFEDFGGVHVLVNVPYMKHLGSVAVGEKRQNLGMRTVQPITWCRCLDGLLQFSAWWFTWPSFTGKL